MVTPKMEKMNAAATDKRCKLPHSVSGCESNRIDSQRKKRNADNKDDRSDLVNILRLPKAEKPSTV